MNGIGINFIDCFVVPPRNDTFFLNFFLKNKLAPPQYFIDFQRFINYFLLNLKQNPYTKSNSNFQFLIQKMTHTILIDCSDAKGLVHKITGVLYHNELNVQSNQEFVEPETNRFFMRTDIVGEMDVDKITNGLQGILPWE
jgi:hypothetical protein